VDNKSYPRGRAYGFMLDSVRFSIEMRWMAYNSTLDSIRFRR